MTGWAPTGGIRAAELRAELLRTTRSFFAERRVLEVDTPVLGRYGTPEPGIASIRAAEQGQWLRTSPEHHMKRLLANDARDVYQVARVFRGAETGPRHHTEFTLIEWYRCGFTLDNLIAECCALLATLAGVGGRRLGAVRRTDYRTLCLQHAGLDPFTAEDDQLRRTAAEFAGRAPADVGADRRDWLDLIVSHAVYPALPADSLQVVTGYPADQAMLARLDPDDPRCAARFEIFLDGVELANGFHELADSCEQRRRFAADNARRQALGLEPVPADEALLAALEHGLPDCCGVAAGLERIQMVASGAADLDAVVTFPPGS